MMARRSDRAGGPSDPSRSVSAKGAHPSRDAAENVYYMPRCNISRKWDGTLDALLVDMAFRTHQEAETWGLRNWGNLVSFGVYFEGVYRFDKASEEPFNAIMGDMLGIGRIAVIGGRLWEREFASDTDGSPQGPDRDGLDGEATAGAEDIAQTPSGDPA